MTIFIIIYIIYINITIYIIRLLIIIRFMTGMAIR